MKILGQILHGGSLKYEYSMLKPNILRLISYDGFGSRIDSDSKFGFGDDTVKSMEEAVAAFKKIFKATASAAINEAAAEALDSEASEKIIKHVPPAVKK